MHARIERHRDVYVSVLRTSGGQASIDSHTRLPLAEVSKGAARDGLQLHGAASRVHTGLIPKPLRFIGLWITAKINRHGIDGLIGFLTTLVSLANDGALQAASNPTSRG